MVRGWNDINCGCSYRPLCGGPECDFIVGDESMTWLEADNWCVNTTGCHLASIQSEADNTAAEALCNDCWLGANCVGRGHGDFRWVDGSDFAYTRWNGGEPNNWDGNEDCVHIWDATTWTMCGASPLSLHLVMFVVAMMCLI